MFTVKTPFVMATRPELHAGSSRTTNFGSAHWCLKASVQSNVHAGAKPRERHHERDGVFGHRLYAVFRGGAPQAVESQDCDGTGGYPVQGGGDTLAARILMAANSSTAVAVALPGNTSSTVPGIFGRNPRVSRAEADELGTHACTDCKRRQGRSARHARRKTKARLRRHARSTRWAVAGHALGRLRTQLLLLLRTRRRIPVHDDRRKRRFDNKQVGREKFQKCSASL